MSRIRRIALALALFAAPALADVSRLPAPASDSLRAERPPAPLIVPGRPAPADSLARPAADRAQEQYAVGRELERNGAGAAAISAYRNAVRIDPTIPDAHYRMGRLFSNVSQHKYAAREYAAELKLRPDHVPSSRWLGLELAQLGDTAAAIARLRSLVQADPVDEPSWQALGFAYATAGRPLEGEQALRRALSLDPGDADAWRDLGVVLAATHRDAEARDAYRHAARLAPRDTGTRVNLGNLQLRAGHADSALAAYDAAIDVDSTSVLGWRGKVNALIALNRLDDAGRAYRSWLQLPEAPQSLRVEAMEFFASRGRQDIALELARDGVRRTPRSAEAHLALGMALHESGQDRAALPELRRAEAMFVRAEPSARVGALIRSLRAKAPDSLRALYRADSIANEAGRVRVPLDSLDATRRRR